VATVLPPEVRHGHDEDGPDKVRWDRAVRKGAKLLESMTSSESQAGKIFSPPRDTSESIYQDYSKSSPHIPYQPKDSQMFC
jgi:hypothetical protein